MTKQREPKIIHLEHPGEKFWEQVEVDGANQYAFYSPLTELRENIIKSQEEKGLQPLPRESISTGGSQPGPSSEDSYIMYVPIVRCPWPRPGVPDISDGLEGLWGDVRAFLEKYVDLQDPRLYDVLTAWVTATWIPEAWFVVPYLNILGPKNSGKTRLLEVLQALSYRGTMVANISESAIFHATERQHPTLLMDEAEIYGSEARLSIQNLLNSGYRRGQWVIRAVKIEDGQYGLGMFDVFGFKALAGTGSFKDTLESRSIKILMEKAVRKVEFLIDAEEAKRIRTRMLLWRWRSLIRVDELEGSFEKAPERLRFADGRFVELYACLLTVANDGAENILSYARDAYEVEQDEERTSVEAEVLAALASLPSSKVIDGKFRTRDLADIFNEDKPEKEQYGARGLGKLLGRLGFRPKNMTGHVKGWDYDVARINRLAKRYDTPLLETSLTSLTSLKKTPPDMKETPEKSVLKEESPEKQASPDPEPSQIRDVKDVKDVTTGEDIGGKPSTPSLSIGLGQLAGKVRDLKAASRDYLREVLGWPQEYFDKVLKIAARDRLVFTSMDGMVRPT
jgi:hypothetical protein